MHFEGKLGKGAGSAAGRCSRREREMRFCACGVTIICLWIPRAHIFIYPSGGIPELAEDPSLTDAFTKQNKNKKPKQTRRIIIKEKKRY